jgi:hypothetical protein
VFTRSKATFITMPREQFMLGATPDEARTP